MNEKEIERRVNELLGETPLEVVIRGSDVQITLIGKRMKGLLRRRSNYYEINICYWVLDESMLEPFAVERSVTLAEAVDRFVQLCISFDLLRSCLTNQHGPLPDQDVGRYEVDHKLSDGTRLPNVIDLFHIPMRSSIGLSTRCSDRLSKVCLEYSLFLQRFSLGMSFTFSFAKGQEVTLKDAQASCDEILSISLPDAVDKDSLKILKNAVDAISYTCLATELVVRRNTGHSWDWIFDFLVLVGKAIRFGTLTFYDLEDERSTALIKAATMDFLELSRWAPGNATQLGPAVDCTNEGSLGPVFRQG